MGSRAAFKSVGASDFTFVENGETYRTIGGFDNLRVLIKEKGSVKAPEFSHQSKKGVQIKMRLNEYDNLNQFIYEYNRGRRSPDETHERRFMGIEFLHDGVYYRMCREPLPDDDDMQKVYGPDDIKPGYYQVYIMHCEKSGYPGADEFETVGIFDDIYDLLDNCIIGGKFFRDIIMDDNTEILGKD